MKLLLVMPALLGVVAATEATSNRRSSYLRENSIRLLAKNQNQVDWNQFAGDLQAAAAAATPCSVCGDGITVDGNTETINSNKCADIQADAAQFDVSDATCEIIKAYEETCCPGVDWDAFAAALLITDAPSSQPTDGSSTAPSKSPIKHPSSSPITVEESPVTDPTTPAIITTSPTMAVTYENTPTSKPTEFNFLFSLGENAVTKVPLLPIRLDFVATNTMNRKLRADELELMSVETEAAFIEIISNQILSFLKGTLSRELVLVELEVDDKSVRYVSQDNSLVMFSYDLSGSCTFLGSEDDLPPLPTSNELQAEVVGFLETEELVDTFNSFDNKVLRSIHDVTVSIPALSGTSAQIQMADSTGIITDSNDGGSGTGAVSTPIVIVFVTAFAFAIAVIGFITVRKYRQYQQNGDDNSKDSFGRFKSTRQNIKERISNFSPIKSRQYDHFESPQGSKDSLFENFEDNDREYPITSNSDIEHKHSPKRDSPSSSYLSFEAKRVMDDESDTTSENDGPNRTLDLLYSDSDSFFGSSVALSSIVSAGVRPRVLSTDANLMYSDTDSSLHDSEHRRLSIAQNFNHNDITWGTLSNDEITASSLEEGPLDGGHEKMPETNNLFDRLVELENKIIHTESQFSHEDVATTKVRLSDYKNAYSEGNDSSDVHKTRISDFDVFRLSVTPPPSEGDFEGGSNVDGLLGHLSSEESEADDDELLFQEGSVAIN